jgi:membrane protein implicated in regulation of membrane protease activity
MDVIIYAICLVVGVGFALFSAVAGHFLGGHDQDVGTGGHAEAGFEHSGLPGISPFSPTFIACFATAFGALGFIFSSIRVTHSPWVSAPLSAFGGFVIAAIVFSIFESAFRKTQSSSECQVATLVGQTASIITPIPENGVGEIAYVRASTRYTAPARSEHGKPIGPGQAVRITRIVGTQFYVDALQPPV